MNQRHKKSDPYTRTFNRTDSSISDRVVLYWTSFVYLVFFLNTQIVTADPKGALKLPSAKNREKEMQSTFRTCSYTRIITFL